MDNRNREKMLKNDIYFLKDYVSLYLKDNDEIFDFEYREAKNYFYNIAIKRAIKNIGKVSVNDGYFDLETAYGYGGCFTNSNDFNFIKKAFKKYEQKCFNENIIAEFMRFHPFNDFAFKFGSLFDMCLENREVVYLSLKYSKDERWADYSSNTRNILRKCQKELFLKESDDIDTFMSLYKKTMDRHLADSFYYFKKDYFVKLLKNDNSKLFEVIKDGKIISSAIFMFGEDFCHYHLSANDYEMRKFNANYFMLDEMFDIAKLLGKKYFILGGGSSINQNDSLFSFKQKFSKLKKPFFIAGKVYNQEIYQKYNKIWQNQSKENIKFFLKYRLEQK